MILYLGHLIYFQERATLTKQLKKAFHCYQTVFEKSGKIDDQIDIRIMKNT